ncbi:MAG: phosphoribosyltransferase [Patescibacteria group bacterium]|nr:phosphoribosyltransferase [Patescibacteria group bacterium]MDD4610878.1 phosphoribosyltransferase [Patescibacteria group bacterium]
MPDKKWEEVINKIKNFKFEDEFDLVVAIGRGGVVPGYLISRKLGIDLEIIWIKFRDDANNIIFSEPQIARTTAVDFKNKKILLVDDVAKTGKTLEIARKYLVGAEFIKTFVINGQADYFLYNEKCFQFPWAI